MVLGQNVLRPLHSGRVHRRYTRTVVALPRYERHLPGFYPCPSFLLRRSLPREDRLLPRDFRMSAMRTRPSACRKHSYSPGSPLGEGRKRGPFKTRANRRPDTHRAQVCDGRAPLTVRRGRLSATQGNVCSSVFPTRTPQTRRSFAQWARSSFAGWLRDHLGIELVSEDQAGSYAEYHEAVDYLPIERLSVERVSSIAENLGFVEQVRGRKGYEQAALTHG